MPFLRSASRVVRVSWKSVRSWSLGGMVTEPVLVPAPLGGVCWAGAATSAGSAGSAGVADRAIAGTSAIATASERTLPVTGTPPLKWTRANDCTNRRRYSRGSASEERKSSCRVASGGSFAGPIPAQPGADCHGYSRVDEDRKTCEQEDGHERLVVMERSRLEEDVEAETVDRDDELRHHGADQRPANPQADPGNEMRKRRRQRDAKPDLVRSRSVGVGHLEVLRGHRARAVRHVHGDGKERGKDDRRKARRRRVPEPDGEERHHRPHRHRVQPVYVDPEGPLGEAHAPDEEADQRAGDDGDAQSLGHRGEGDAGCGEHRSAREDRRKDGGDPGRLRHIRGRPETDDDLPDPEDDHAARDLEEGGRRGEPAGRVQGGRFHGRERHLPPRPAPDGEAVLEGPAESHQGDAEDGDDQDGGEETCRIEIARRDEEELADAARAEEELRRHHADQGATDRLADAGHRVREGGGDHHVPEERPLAGSERGRHLDQLGTDAARALDGVVEHREEREEEDDQHLGAEVEPEEGKDERDERHHRHRVAERVGVGKRRAESRQPRAAWAGRTGSAGSRARSIPGGSAVTTAIPRPAAKSTRDPTRVLGSSPDTVISYIRKTVSEKGAATAGLRRRVPSSQTAAPAARLRRTTQRSFVDARSSIRCQCALAASAEASRARLGSTSLSYATGCLPGLIPPRSCSVLIAFSTFSRVSPSPRTGQNSISRKRFSASFATVGERPVTLAIFATRSAFFGSAMYFADRKRAATARTYTSRFASTFFLVATRRL